jgi:hypothetical protein
MKRFFLLILLISSSSALPLGWLLRTTATLGAAYYGWKNPIILNKPLAIALEKINSIDPVVQVQHEAYAQWFFEKFPEKSPAYLSYALKNSIEPGTSSLFTEDFIQDHKKSLAVSDLIAARAAIYAAALPHLQSFHIQSLAEDMATVSDRYADKVNAREKLRAGVVKHIVLLEPTLLKEILSLCTAEDKKYITTHLGARRADISPEKRALLKH